MTSKKLNKKNKVLKNIQQLFPKNLNLDKYKVDPINVIEKTKNKIGNFYVNFKNEREKEKKKIRKDKKN